MIKILDPRPFCVCSAGFGLVTSDTRGGMIWRAGSPSLIGPRSNLKILVCRRNEDPYTRIYQKKVVKHFGNNSIILDALIRNPALKKEAFSQNLIEEVLEPVDDEVL